MQVSSSMTDGMMEDNMIVNKWVSMPVLVPADDSMSHAVRRVKCDEKRPSSDRCTSTCRKCDGYEHHEPGVDVNNRPSRRIDQPCSGA